VTDQELHTFAWRECSTGMSDPFCWSGSVHLVMQVAVMYFKKGYQCAAAIDKAKEPKV